MRTALVLVALALGLLALGPVAAPAAGHHAPLHVCDHDGRSCDDDGVVDCSRGVWYKLGVCPG